ncbi:hypothetical protein AVEN_70081-1 [Araneus ventricosus]|uniref:Uncharacterized protein n=1 Tax=Araneus ventricosus TaxID=182803 RepID=A0A4Y2Q368_ARAVE|nr:hypothetical protein AVEN_70081-1 [Araneus ventricosus]
MSRFYFADLLNINSCFVERFRHIRNAVKFWNHPHRDRKCVATARIKDAGSGITVQEALIRGSLFRDFAVICILKDSAFPPLPF